MLDILLPKGGRVSNKYLTIFIKQLPRKSINLHLLKLKRKQDKPSKTSKKVENS